MAIITEDYVSFETAKLLKEKGFKGQGEHFYENGKIIDYINYWYRITPKQRYEAIEAPTLQMAMKWLRKEKNIFIDVYYEKDIKGYMYSIIKLTKGTILNASDLADNSYEQACEAAIKYCLKNLI